MTTHEQYVIGSMLLSRTAIEGAVEECGPEDFADPRHAAAFAAAAHVDSEGKPVSALSVHDHLKTGDVRVDLAYLHELTGVVATPASAGYYAQQVRADSIRRTVREAGTRLATMPEAADPLEEVNAARQELDALAEQRVSGVTNEQAVYDAIDSLDAPLGIKTPWRALDEIVSGWAPGMLYVIGARPGIGKTAAGVGILLDVARRGHLAIMASLEMPRNELYLRMLSSVGAVDAQRIMHRSTRRDDDERLAKAAAHIAGLPLHVDDRSALSLAQIRALVRTQQRRRDVGVVVVDYLGLVKPPSDTPRNDRRVQVDAIAQGLKNLARDLGVPVVALAQLNRGIEGRADKVPSLSDLRESGGIEAAADCVLLMHRDDMTDPRDLVINAAKNRHGPKAVFHLDFRGEFSRIEDRTTQHLGAIA